MLILFLVYELSPYVVSFINNELSNRLCITCDKRYATSRGLDDHRTRNKECGSAAKKLAKARKIKELRLRQKSIHGLKLKRIGPHKKKLSTPRKRGAPLSREEKEFVLHNYDQYRSKNFSVANSHTLWKNKKFTTTQNIFRQINYHLVKFNSNKLI